MSTVKKYEMVELATWHCRDADDALMYAEGPDGTQDLNRPMLIHLWGPGSKKHNQAQQARSNRTIGRIQRRGKADMSADEALREQVEFVTECTQSMENMEELSERGAKDEALWREVYQNLRLSFIVAGAEMFARNTANFRPLSTTS